MHEGAGPSVQFSGAGGPKFPVGASVKTGEQKCKGREQKGYRQKQKAVRLDARAESIEAEWLEARSGNNESRGE